MGKLDGHAAVRLTDISVSVQKLTITHRKIITGGSQGFGAGIVAKFIAEGANVLNIDLKPPKEGEGVDGATFMRGDVTKRETWQQALKLVEEQGWTLLSVVNNAGWTYPAKSTNIVTEAEFDNESISKPPFADQVLVPHFQHQDKGGSFLTISSTAALRPRPNLVWYNATKGAISTASKGLAVEFAKDQIRFNCICPVAGNTPLLASFAGGELTEEKRKMFTESIPLGRLSEPSDIANAACFLASEEAKFITGVDLEVDGGRCI